MGSSIPVPEVMTTEKEAEPSIHVPKAVAAKKEVELSVPVSKIVSFEADISSQEDTEIHRVELTILILGEDVDPMVEALLPRESVALKTEAPFPLLSLWRNRRC